MATPSKSFTNIPDTAVDAESPLDTTLMTQIRDSLIHLEEWIGKNYTAAVDHDHDGVNSKLVSAIGDDVITGLSIDRSTFSMFNDCIDISQHGWTSSGTPTLQSEVNGVIRMAASEAFVTNDTFFDLNSGNITMEFKVKGSSGEPKCGISDSVGGQMIGILVNNAIGFYYNTSTNKIACNTESGGVSTVTDTDTDVSASFQILKIIATALQVDFYIDGVLKVSHTTNIPTSTLYGAFGSDATNSDYDYALFNQDGR
jgi:hypothetical protein